MARVFVLVWAVLAGMAVSGQAGEMPPGMAAAQVVFLGEVHDNPAAHARQAELVAALQPKALVFEMLPSEVAEKVTPDVRGDEAALEQALHWADLGWPDFAMYYPIFAAAPDAWIFGAAVPRAKARAAMKTGVAESFGKEADAYGLRQPLPEDEQATRERFQFEAHCDAMPEEMLPVMVQLQRLRDATLARAAFQALDQTGGPVVVITGNGHARRDWGAPAYLERVSAARIFSLGLVEQRDDQGVFDALETVAEADREDPCAAFRK